MKKVLLIFGIVIISAGVLSLMFAGLNMFAYNGTLDGSAELYGAMQRRMIIFGVVGIVLAIIGTACIIIRSKI